MSLFVVGSVRGAPGGTTVASLVAKSLGEGVLAEADLDGGVLAVRHHLGRVPGLTTLAAARTTAPEGWRDHAQEHDGLRILVGPDTPRLAVALWSRAGEQLAAAFTGADAEVVVDAGRLRGHPALRTLLAAASLVVVVVRPEAEDLVTLSHQLPDLQAQAREVAVVLAGSGRYWSRDVTSQLDVRVLGLLREHPCSLLAQAERPGSAGTQARDELTRWVRTLVESMVARADLDGAGAAEPASPPIEHEAGSPFTEVEVIS